MPLRRNPLLHPDVVRMCLEPTFVYRCVRSVPKIQIDTNLRIVIHPAREAIQQANENRESEFFFIKIKNVFPGFP